MFEYYVYCVYLEYIYKYAHILYMYIFKNIYLYVYSHKNL